MADALSVNQQIVASIGRIIRAIDLHSRRLVESHGLTGPQLVTLQAIERAGGIAPSALAREVHLSQGTMTGILQRLERGGFVTRSRNTSDRRSVIVELSEEGRSLLATAPSLLQDRLREGLETLETWEQHMILATLHRVAALLDAENIDASPHLVSGAGLPIAPEPPEATPDAS